MRPQRGKQKLIDAATHLFESQGYFATTVEQITREAGVSKGLVYNYFRSKEELLVELIESATRQMITVAGTLTPGDSVDETMPTFIDNFLRFLKTERRFLKLQLTLMLMPELQQVVIGPQRQRAARLLALLESWCQQAKINRPKAKARLILAMLDGVALHYLCIFEKYPLKSMKPQLVQAIRDICENTKQEPK